MFKENFERLCSKRGKAPSAVCDEIGLSRTMYSKWDNDSIPRKVTLIKIADYFGVTPESLVAENEQKKVPSEMDGEENEKNEIAKIFSDLLPEQQEQAKKYLRYLLDTQEKTSQDNL